MWSSLKGYLLLALVLGGLALAGGIYAKGRLDATHKAAMSALQQTIDDLQAAQEADRLARLADTAQAREDATALAALEAANKELLDALSAPDTVCLPPADADKLRKL